MTVVYSPHQLVDVVSLGVKSLNTMRELYTGGKTGPLSWLSIDFNA